MKYERLHDRVIAKVSDILMDKLEDGDEEGCEKRVEALKKYWNKRLNVYKKDVKVSLVSLNCASLCSKLILF